MEDQHGGGGGWWGLSFPLESFAMAETSKPTQYKPEQ